MGKTETLEYTQNRELSWLRFNQRVLEEAQDESVPLMERMKFVAIFTSNLDEFFMIRVGSLYDMAVADSKKQDIRSGMTPKQQLEEMGYAMVSGKVRPGEVLHSILTTPVLWSVLLGLTLYLFRVNVPELIRQPLQLVGNMNTPLSMIITGMLIAGSKPEKLLGNREIYRIILIHMLFIPLVSFLLFRLLSVQGMVAEVVLLLEACPCAAITSVFAVQFGYDEDLAAGSVVITTFISIVVLPLCAMALTMMM